ncbi:MAG: hypothetical protein DWQ06_15635 [Calditrichaeota bacterium]|nr:MAG: hypothetical protein DWQ06_15635 [Calditrichota bacterium]
MVNFFTSFFTFLFILSTQTLFAKQSVEIFQSSPQELIFIYSPSVKVDTSELTKEIKVVFGDAQQNSLNGEFERNFLVGIAENSNPSIQVLETEFQKVSGFKLHKNISQEIDNPSSISRNLVSIEKGGKLRFLPVAKVSVNPVRTDGNGVEILTSIKVKINLDSPTNLKRKSLPKKELNFYKSQVLNFGQIELFASMNTISSLSKPNDNLGKVYRISLSEEGIYKITGKWLTDNIADFSLNEIPSLSEIRLFGFGSKRIELAEFPEEVPKSLEEFWAEIPIEIKDNNGNGKFDSDDFFIFYGRPLNFWKSFSDPSGNPKVEFSGMHPYAEESNYFLNFDSGITGKRFEAKNSETASETVTSYTELVRGEVDRVNPLHTGTKYFAGVMTYTGSGNGNTPAEANPDINFSDFVQGTNLDYKFVYTAYDFYQYVGGGYKNKFSVTANGQNLGTSNVTTGGWTTSFREGILEGTLPLTQENYSFRSTFSISPTSGEAAFDFYEFRYERNLKAVGNELVFFGKNSSEAVRYQTTNFSQKPRVFEISDFDELTEITGTNYSSQNLTFGNSETAEAKKLYYLTVEGNFKTPLAIERKKFGGTAPHLRDTDNSADFLIITHEDFYDEALRLKEFREANSDPRVYLKTEVILTQDIYDEFSGGIYDALALRDFLHYTFNNWRGNSGAEIPPRYVLFLGDSDFDFRNLEFDNDNNWVPTFEVDAGSDLISRATDDKFAMLTEGDVILDLATGRVPAESAEEAQIFIDKIIAYEGSPKFGDWRMRVTLVGDDEFAGNGSSNEFLHISQSESLAGIITNGNPRGFDLNKIYLPEYPTVSDAATATGRGKPEAADDLLSSINNLGSLVVNYIGHGNPTNWAHERVFNQDRHLGKLKNEHLPLFIAATCDFGVFDPAEGSKSFTEELILLKEAGGIGVVSASRITLSNANAALNNQFFTQLFRTEDQFMRLGDALMKAKNSNGSSTTPDSNEEKYYLFSDPTLIFASPRLRASNLQITGGSIKALSPTEIKGTILDEANSQALANFNGTVTVKILDANKSRPHGNSGYTLQGNNLFKGNVTSDPTNPGNFSAKFFTPKDISYEKTAKILVYFNDSSKDERLRFDGSGILEGVLLEGGNVAFEDSVGPEINFEVLTEGTDEIETMLDISISDSTSGINLTGKQGHRIILTFDKDYDTIYDLTDRFTYETNSFTNGKILYEIEELEEGEHTFEITAWDNFNNATTVEGKLFFASESSFELEEVYNFPNPMTKNDSQTEFIFKLNHSQVNSSLDVEVKIYTLAGRLIETLKLNEQPQSGGSGFYSIPWSGRDRDGDKISNGTYFYYINASSETEDGEVVKASKIGKLAIIR